MSKRILIAEITTAHGIKGYVKVRSYAEDESILNGAPLYLGESGSETLSLSLKNALKGDWVAEVKGVTDRNAAEKLRGTKLYIERDSLPETDDGEFYIEDLKGFLCRDENGVEIGTVEDIVNYGASDLLDIKPSGGGATFYIPFTDDTVLNVDEEERTITLSLPETL